MWSAAKTKATPISPPFSPNASIAFRCIIPLNTSSSTNPVDIPRPRAKKKNIPERQLGTHSFRSQDKVVHKPQGYTRQRYPRHFQRLPEHDTSILETDALNPHHGHRRQHDRYVDHYEPSVTGKICQGYGEADDPDQRSEGQAEVELARVLTVFHTGFNQERYQNYRVENQSETRVIERCYQFRDDYEQDESGEDSTINPFTHFSSLMKT